MDNFPAYNFNQGRGLDDADTKELGSTLLTAMLKEVNRFCDLSTKKDWSQKTHQQVHVIAYT